jgi:hypothetical protein
MSEKCVLMVSEKDHALLEAAKNVGLHHAYGINHTKGNFNVHGVAVSAVYFPAHYGEEDRIHCKDGAWLVGSGVG